METSLSVGNDAVLRSARRWIIAAYVWQIINLFIGYWGIWPIIDYLTNQGLAFDTANIYKYRGIFYIIIFEALLAVAFIKLKTHSNSVLRQSATILLVAVIMSFAIYFINFINSEIYPLILDLFWNLRSLLLFFVVIFFLVVLFSYLFIVAYAHLNKCYAIRSNHPEVVVLCILTFISSAMTICIYSFMLIYSFNGITGHGNAEMSISLYYTLSEFMTLGISVACILCWKRLLGTPSDIPDVEEKPEKISFVPSKVEIGYLVSLLLFTAVVYTALYIILPI